MDSPHDCEATLHFFTTEEGGRESPCRSGSGQYRPLCDFGREDGKNGVLCEFVDKEWVSPGETVNTKMWLLYPQLLAGRICEGFEFTVHEGRCVATGTITKVVNEALRKNEVV